MYIYLPIIINVFFNILKKGYLLEYHWRMILSDKLFTYLSDEISFFFLLINVLKLYNSGDPLK